MKAIASLHLTLWILIACGAASASEVLVGVPTFKITQTSQGAIPEALRPEKQQEFAVVIERVGDKYFWVSRGRRELSLNQSGAYSIFSEVKGNGYIKVFSMADAEGYEFMEHLHQNLGTVTYWGRSRRFAP